MTDPREKKTEESIPDTQRPTGTPVAKIEPKKVAVPVQQPQVVLPQPVDEATANKLIDEIEANADKNPPPPVPHAPNVAHPSATPIVPPYEQHYVPPAPVPPSVSPLVPQVAAAEPPVSQEELLLRFMQRNPYQVLPQGTPNFGTYVVVNSPRFGPVSANDALCIAAWLIKVAEETGHATVSFADVWERINA